MQYKKNIMIQGHITFFMIEYLKIIWNDKKCYIKSN